MRSTVVGLLMVRVSAERAGTHRPSIKMEAGALIGAILAVGGWTR
jgi:hypothetical protein